jgi:AcrR family transcriptional regulator
MQDKAKAILEAALKLALEHGLHRVTRDMVAAEARVCGALVNRYWNTHAKLMDQVVTTAVEREVLPVIAQALAVRHPNARAAPAALKADAVRLLLVR